MPRPAPFAYLVPRRRPGPSAAGTGSRPSPGSRKATTGLLLFLAPTIASCEGIQAIGPRDGAESAAISDLFTIFLVVTLLFYAAVIAFLVSAWWRRRGERQDGLSEHKADTSDAALNKALILWTGAVILGLTGLTLASYLTDRAIARSVPAGEPVLSVEIVANQWWWDIRYHFPDPSKNVRTANELHLPVGVPAMIYLKSNDVIHSFWVPNLAGKQDLIPGKLTDAVLVPRRTGQYRGQCAEYCGVQHAHMALDVTVESKADFARWLATQQRPAPAPANPLERAGYDYVTTRECSSCHAIAGTSASGQVGPDLTHLIGRRSIAAGTYPMTRGHLYAWIADPQSAKPGNYMPVVGLDAEQLHAIVAYLETLK
jgi:cytochrome c oxidase subunit 2